MWDMQQHLTQIDRHRCSSASATKRNDRIGIWVHKSTRHPNHPSCSESWEHYLPLHHSPFHCVLIWPTRYFVSIAGLPLPKEPSWKGRHAPSYEKEGDAVAVTVTVAAAATAVRNQYHGLHSKVARKQLEDSWGVVAGYCWRTGLGSRWPLIMAWRDLLRPVRNGLDCTSMRACEHLGPMHAFPNISFQV
jgi:hypothetical protein